MTQTTDKTVKVKLSLYRPRWSRGLQEVQAPRIFIQSAHEVCKIVSPLHRPPLPIREDPWYSFLLEAESNPGP